MIVELAFEETISNVLTRRSLQVDSVTQSHHQKLVKEGKKLQIPAKLFTPIQQCHSN